MEDIFELAAACTTAPTDLFYACPPPLPPQQQPHRSAFVPYLGNDRTEVFHYCGEKEINSCRSSSRNVPKRVIEILRCIPSASNDEKATTNTRSHTGSLSFRHMMRERNRRERQSQCYQDLHSMVSHGSKVDKNSILQSAVVNLRELKATEAELQRRNQELKLRIRKIEEDGCRSENGKKIEVRVVNPASSIDSIASAFLRLKEMGAGVKSFRSKFSSEEFVATIEVETKANGIGDFGAICAEKFGNKSNNIKIAAFAGIGGKIQEDSRINPGRFQDKSRKIPGKSQ